MVYESPQERKERRFFGMLKPKNVAWSVPIATASIYLGVGDDTPAEKISRFYDGARSGLEHVTLAARGGAERAVGQRVQEVRNAAAQYAQTANAPTLEAEVKAKRERTVGTVRIAALPNEGVDALLRSVGHNVTDKNTPAWRAYFQEENGLSGNAVQEGVQYEVPIFEDMLAHELSGRGTYVPVRGRDGSVVGFLEYAVEPHPR